MSKTNRGPVGGAGDEAGGQHRRGLAALFAAHGLNGLPLEGLPVGGERAIVEAVGLESDFPVDDVFVQLRGGRLFIQAKRTLRFGRPMREVAAQWLRAVRDPDFNEIGDWIAAAAGTLSKEIGALAQALDRRRLDATSFSSTERRSIEALVGLLREEGASDFEVELVLSRAVVLSFQVEASGQEYSERGRLLLDGHVVAKGDGARAWRELIAIAGDAARLRLGHSVGAWLEELRKRQVDLTVDAAASRAGYLARRAEALGRYRQQLRRRGEYVDLTSIGLAIRSIALSEMDAEIRVRHPDADERADNHLLWSFRRRGRVVLTGLPGGGKSISVAATAAEWATREDWELPLAVSLRRLAEPEHFRRKALRDQILDLATESVEPRDRSLVRDALDEALSAGQAVLFLDGLDEAADRSLLLATDLAQLLAEVHPDTDVLLATRDVAYANARILGFDDLRLNTPKNLSKTLTAVLRALAEQRGIGDASAWVATRLEWVERSLALDPPLAETPLMPVLLASLAADREVADLPRTRVLILEQVIQDVVRRKESRREIQITGLPAGHETAAVLGAFPRIAIALSTAGGSARRAQLGEQLALYLRDDWGLPPAMALTTAEQILVFWDESGIFVASGADKIVTPRLRLFLEIGVALYAASRPDQEAEEWVSAAAMRPDSREALILAAGRSRIIADALIDRACREDGEAEDALALAAVQALGQGASPSESRLRQLIGRVSPLLQPGDDAAWRVFRLLARITVPDDLQDSILNSVRASFDADHYAVAAALVSVDWGWDPDNRDEHLEAGLRVSELPSLKRRQPRQGKYLTMRDLFTDSAFMRVKEQAASILLPKHPELAPVVVQALEHASIATSDVLMGVLRRNGHHEAAASAARRWFDGFQSVEQFTRSTKRLDDDLDNLLTTVASLSRPAVLSLSQQRRLRELAVFVESLNLNQISALMSGDELHSLRIEFVHLIATLGAFDEGVLAAEANIVQREVASDSLGSYKAFFSLFGVSPGTDLKHWDRVPDAGAARDVLLRVLHTQRGSAVVAAVALAEHPDRRETAKMIEQRFHDLPYESVVPAVWAVVSLLGEAESEIGRLSRSNNENVRQAIAEIVTLAEAGRPSDVATQLASDPCRQVRLAVVEKLGKEVPDRPTPELLRLLEATTHSTDPPFECRRCGTANPASSDSCSSCHVVTRRPSAEATQLLERYQRSDSVASR
jgi:hypothetical protein